nr:MAG TPA: hypothetical protein [Caudoviricetes sp.]
MSGRALPFSDLDRIQTCNLLSRNQMRYSVAPRGLYYYGCKDTTFFDFASIFMKKYFLPQSIYG